MRAEREGIVCNVDEHQHGFDLIAGQRTPQRVVTGQETLSGTQRGSICVHVGAHLIVAGTQQGTVTFRSGGSGSIIGAVQGTLNVAQGAEVDITGQQLGTVHVEHDGVVTVHSGGTIAGTIQNVA